MKLDPFKNAIEQASRIVIIQADNPDGDSLASALALEEILSVQGKTVDLYCGVDIPGYLRYMPGWDRVIHDLPQLFDMSIIVDTSAVSLLETLQKSGQLSWLKTKPCFIIDHHQTEETVDFATDIINIPTVSAGEVVYKVSDELAWPISVLAAELIAFSILSDSLGLTSEAVNASTFRTMGKLAEIGVNVAKIDDARRQYNKKSKAIVAYKGSLLQRIEYTDDPRIAMITIPWEEIEKYSHEYNPSMLVMDEMRMIDHVQLAIAFKTYPDGKITAKIRANFGYKVAGELAEYFGGGGHGYAAGFKLTDKKSLDEVKSKCIAKATELLDRCKKDSPNETVQYTF